MNHDKLLERVTIPYMVHKKDQSIWYELEYIRAKKRRMRVDLSRRRKTDTRKYGFTHRTLTPHEWTAYQKIEKVQQPV